MFTVARVKKILLVICVVISYLAYFILVGLLANDWFQSGDPSIDPAYSAIMVLMFAWLILSLVLGRGIYRQAVPYTTGTVSMGAGNSEKLNPDVLINSIVDGVMLVGSDQVVKVFNPAASTITGWNAQEALGLNYKSVLKYFDDKGIELGEDKNRKTC